MSKPYINKFTEGGLKAMKEEYEALSRGRGAAVEELTWARDMGDRSENAAYKSARRKLSSLDSRLRFLKRIIENSKVIKPLSCDFVDIGCRVRVKIDEKESEFFIVGDHETNPSLGKISCKSPIGLALLGKKIGDKLLVSTPSAVLPLTVMKISLE